MELEKVKIHRIQQNGTAVSQITLDDDYNVPDYRPDIMKVLKENGELRFDEVKAANKAVWVKGSLVFHILYQCEQSDGKISCLKGEIPFQEKLNIDGLQENGEVHAAGEIEDLTVGVINSRKLSIRAVVVLRASAEEQVLEEFTSRLELPGDYQQKTGTWGADSGTADILKMQFSPAASQSAAHSRGTVVSYHCRRSLSSSSL